MSNVVQFAERHVDLWPSEWCDVAKLLIDDLRVACVASEDDPGNAAKKAEAVRCLTGVEDILNDVKRTLNKF